MDWTIILSYVGLILFLRIFYMMSVGFVFILTNTLTKSFKLLRIAFSSFLIWLFIGYIWNLVNDSAMPLLAYVILICLMSIQLLVPNFKEVKDNARFEILGLLLSAFYNFILVGFNWY